MARDRQSTPQSTDAVISIIGPGMKVVGDLVTEGTVRVEGLVEGGIQAGKAVVIGKDGCVIGDVRTQDAVLSGRMEGTLIVESRLEIHSSAEVHGDIRARRLQLEEGAILNGTVLMGEAAIQGAVPDHAGEATFGFEEG